MKARLLACSMAMQVGTTMACTDSGNFQGSLLPCTNGCSTTTMTCAQLAAVGGCEKHFGELFDFSANTATPTSSGTTFAFDATTAVALGCCSTCNVDGLSAKDVDDLITLFIKFDKDGDGSIDQSELKALLHLSGVDVTDEQVATVLADDDTDGDGRIEFGEFVGIIQRDLASHPCYELPTNVAGQTLTCSHYVQLGYSCQTLTTTPQFMRDFDCHCSCPGANSQVAPAPGAKRCNAAALSAACADPSIMTPDHLCDNMCSAYMLGHWPECSTDSTVDQTLIRAFEPVHSYCTRAGGSTNGGSGGAG